MFRLTTAMGLVLAVSACGYPAGEQINTGDFGKSTTNNVQVMNGELDYAVSLGQRFAREIPTTVNFAFDSTLLDGEAQATLDKQADWIRQFPEVKFRVYGYTDAVGSAAYNKRLGQRRANAVVRYLSSRGISRSRLEALVSFGETRPVIDTPNRERVNRRSVTEVAGFVKRHPTVLDGKYAQIIYRDYVQSATATSGLTGFAGTGGFTTEQ